MNIYFFCFLRKMLEGSSIYWMQQTFWSLVRCAIYKAIWGPPLKIILLRFRTFMYTKAVLSNYKKSNYDCFLLIPTPTFWASPKLSKQVLMPHQPFQLPFYFFFLPWFILYACSSFLNIHCPSGAGRGNLVSGNNLSLSLIEQFEFRSVHSLWPSYLSFKLYLYSWNERTCT